MSCARGHACLRHTAGLMFLHISFSVKIPHLVKTYDGTPCQKKIWYPQNMMVFFVLNLLYP